MNEDREVHGNDLAHAIASALNRFSAENGSNTPDWILAQFLLGCLASWNTGLHQRETWYGRSMTSASDTPRATDPNTHGWPEGKL